MTHDEVESILIYHNKNGFNEDLKDLNERIADMTACTNELKSFYFSLAIPNNKNVSSPVEIVVMKNVNITQMKLYANELHRFVNKLDRIINTLPSSEREVINARYFDKSGKIITFDELEVNLNKSRPSIVSLNKSAINKIIIQLSNCEDSNISIIAINSLMCTSY